MKVDFVIAGAQKSGTTALAEFLAQNPEIGIPNNETNFFLRHKKKIVSEVEFDEYHQNFVDVINCRIIGEKSPNYMPRKWVVKHLHDYNKKMKIIFMLRNPIERSFSQYNMRFNFLNNEPITSFSEVIRREHEILISNDPNAYEKAVARFGYLCRGLYYQHLIEFNDFFPSDQIFIALSEDLKENHDGTITKVNNFLGADNYIPEKREVSALEYKDRILEEDKNFLLCFFREHILRLQDFLNRDLSEWLC